MSACVLLRCWYEDVSCSAIPRARCRLPIQEVTHERGNLITFVLQREVTGVEKMKFRTWQVAQVGFRAGSRKNDIVFAPDDHAFL